ncbi:MAG: bacteriocin-protection, YdeI/OmpD-Associated family protein [Ramlibacter sp.]|nr:bacteriocin-protection, YdeI/OmpD-Associated family protein [Ramlibacter sp.]
MKRDPRVTAYIQARAPFARPILRRLRAVIHEAHSAVEESIRWGMPTFLYRDRIVCGLGAFKAHCALWFKDGKAVVGRKPEGGMGHFGRITSLDDLPAAATIQGYVRKAIEFVDRQQHGTPAGDRPRRRPSARQRRAGGPRS